jgi:glucan phosphorylase
MYVRTVADDDGCGNTDNLGAYQAAALSVRDNLIMNWNETQLAYTRKAPKRAYYLSLEFLMGRALDNAVRWSPGHHSANTHLTIVFVNSF